MKKNILQFLFLFIFVSILFPLETKTIDTKNEFGGKTITNIYNSNDREFKQATSTTVFYDGKNNIRKRIHYLSPLVKKETGINTQEEIFENGIITQYNMVMADEAYEISGVKYITEKINSNKEIYEFVKFASPVQSIDETDRQIILYYLRSLEQEDIAKIYTDKIAVMSEGKKYTAYLQSPFKQYISENQMCLLTYQVIGYKNELFLMVTEFNEIVD